MHKTSDSVTVTRENVIVTCPPHTQWRLYQEWKCSAIKSTLIVQTDAFIKVFIVIYDMNKKEHWL